MIVTVGDRLHGVVRESINTLNLIPKFATTVKDKVAGFYGDIQWLIGNTLFDKVEEDSKSFA